MFVYALAKGVRMGYLPQSRRGRMRGVAGRGFREVCDERARMGGMVLHGTVKVGGLGGTPYRSGTFEYYVGRRSGIRMPRAWGRFCWRARRWSRLDERAGAAGEDRADGCMVQLADAEGCAGGERSLFHYKWDDGFERGRFVLRVGVPAVRCAAGGAEMTAPTAANLKKAQVYVIVSPDNAAKNPIAALHG